MSSAHEKSDDFWLRTVGERIARARLDQNLTQAQVAHQAGVGLRTLQRLERGEAGTQLSSFIRVCRTLELLDGLERFLPEPTPSPIQMLKRYGQIRKRASAQNGDRVAENRPDPYSKKGTLDGKTPKKWTWGE